MIRHVMVGTTDLIRAKAFYDQIMPLLGACQGAWTSDQCLFYERGDGPMFAVTKPFDGLPATVGNGAMVAFEAPSRAAVTAIYERAIALGAQDEGAPGMRGTNPDGFYMAYFRDPDGNKLCVLHFGPPD